MVAMLEERPHEGVELQEDAGVPPMTLRDWTHLSLFYTTVAAVFLSCLARNPVPALIVLAVVGATLLEDWIARGAP